MALTQLASNGVPAQPGHLDVRNYDIRPYQAANIEKVVASRGDVDFMPVLAEHHC
jgi:hypothetical protein